MIDTSEYDDDTGPKSQSLRWAFRLALATIALFVLLCGVGAFLPKDFSVESLVEIDADPEDVYPFLIDMNEFQTWSPWAGNVATQDYIVGGAEYGVGQESAWRCQDKSCIPGTQQIIAAEEAEFVQTEITLLDEPLSAVYAISPSDKPGKVMVLMKVDRSLGGFPFVQRFLKSSKSKRMEKRYAAALMRLKQQVEQDIAS